MSNLPAKKYQKSNPTVTRLSFIGSGGTTRFIDLAAALSMVNRKAYRQGVYYYVSSVECYNSTDAYVDLHTIPDTYVTKNAWKRGFRAFQAMNAQVFTPRPKYHDFKVRMIGGEDSDQAPHSNTNTMYPELFGINGTYDSLAPDEWIYSYFTTMLSDGGASDEFQAHMLGPHVGAVHNREAIGLIKSYSDSRPEPDQSGAPILPVAHSTDPLNTLFDASEDFALQSIAENLVIDNDETPYDADLYNGELQTHMQHVARLATAPMTGRVAKSSGFCAPLGLICVDPQEIHESTDKYRIVINLAVGTYNGVYAERI